MGSDKDELALALRASLWWEEGVKRFDQES